MKFGITSFCSALSLMTLLCFISSAKADNPYCYNHLDKETYTSGFSESDFSSNTDVKIENGQLTLETDDKELVGTNYIKTRTQQDLKVYYLYESAGASHTLGWFVFDDNVKKYLYEDGWNHLDTKCTKDDDCDDPDMVCAGFSTGCAHSVCNEGGPLQDGCIPCVTGICEVDPFCCSHKWDHICVAQVLSVCGAFCPLDTEKYCSYRAYSLRDDGTGGGKAKNKVFDWFEDLYESSCPTCTPHLLTSPYSDGGTYKSIPNLLEKFAKEGGGWTFLLCDDDTDTNTGGGNSPRLPPVADQSTSFDGIPDYDVDEDSKIDINDRLVELGTFDAGTELVFLTNVYYGQSVRKGSVGIEGKYSCKWVNQCPDGCSETMCNLCGELCSSSPGWVCCTSGCYEYPCHKCRRSWQYICDYEEDTSTIKSRIVPFFSKRTLNPDYKPAAEFTCSHDPCQTGVALTNSCNNCVGTICAIDPYCCNTWWDSTCVSRVGNNCGISCPHTWHTGYEYIERDIGCGYPGWCSGYQGWLDNATLNRLQNDFGLTMPHETRRINVRLNGKMNHMFLGAPTTDPTWWLLGFEDLYDGGDKDYNDVVFLVWRTNSGEVVSEMIAEEIPPESLEDTTVTKIKITKKDVIPIPPCSSNPEDARIDYYVSVSEDANGKPIWIKVEFPADSPDEVTINLQEMGHTGSSLRWKAVIISSNHKCQPYVESINVGYEALKHGEYVFTSPLPLANAMYRGATETPHKSWTVTGNDRSNRGRFKVYELYSPNNPENETMLQIWDAGEVLASRNPDDRSIYTNKDGGLFEFKTSADAWLFSKVLTPGDRAKKHNGKPVYDFNSDSSSDDDDARWIIDWTRGWETPKTEQRAWKLGAINSSTGAIVHVPGEPKWLQREGIDAAIKTSYRSWAQDPSRAERRTIAVVGSQSGMIHAFDAGAFRWGDNPETTDIVEQRGHFKYSGANPDYGNGKEQWAYVPESLLNNLKNNMVRNYFPEENPMAMVDGSIAATDIFWKNSWKTAIFATMGRIHPFITALDVTVPLAPEPLWSADWTDPDFHGTTAAPSLSWVDRGSAGPEGKTWMAVTGSGLAPTPSDVFLFLIDLETGNTMTNGKVKLNVGGGLRDEKAYGIAGRPVLLDFSGDGYTDRIYVADTNGRIWKHEPNRDPGNACMVASLGQPIYTTPTIALQHDHSNGEALVAIYVGTGDRPDSNDVPDPPYYFYALADQDLQTECSLAEVLYEEALPPDEKVWADAVLATDRVYVGTSTGDKAHICDEDPNNPGHIYVFDMNPGPSGNALELADPVGAGGSVIAGLMVHDEHVFANTLGGKTNIIGGSTWNNLANFVDVDGLREIYWQEVNNAK